MSYGGIITCKHGADNYSDVGGVRGIMGVQDMLILQVDERFSIA